MERKQIEIGMVLIDLVVNHIGMMAQQKGWQDYYFMWSSRVLADKWIRRAELTM